MSKRRKKGDWVWSIMYGSPFYAEIIDDKPNYPCMEPDCKDDNCMEWANLLTSCNSSGLRNLLHLVSECQMKNTKKGLANILKKERGE